MKGGAIEIDGPSQDFLMRRLVRAEQVIQEGRRWLKNSSDLENLDRAIQSVQSTQEAFGVHDAMRDVDSAIFYLTRAIGQMRVNCVGQAGPHVALAMEYLQSVVDRLDRH